MKKIPLFFAFALIFFQFSTVHAAEMQTVVYKVYLAALPAEIAHGITEGETVTDGAGKGMAGKVTDVLCTPTLDDVYLEATDTVVAVPRTTHCDVLLTVSAAVKREGNVLRADTLLLRRGKTVALHPPHYCGEGIIVEVEG